jgi:hypothetical protein
VQGIPAARLRSNVYVRPYGFPPHHTLDSLKISEAGETRKGILRPRTYNSLMGTTKAVRKERVRKKYEVAKAEMHLMQATEREELRKQDTRQKIVMGAIVKQQMTVHPTVDAWMKGLLDKLLVRPRDRALFGLAPLPPKEAAAPVAKLGVGTLAAGEEGPAIVPFALHRVEPPDAPEPSRPSGSPKSKADPETPR